MSDSKRERKRKWDVVDPQALAQQIAAKVTTDAFSVEIAINDCPPATRYSLTKGSTHDQIHKETTAIVVTRGRYVSPAEMSMATEKPLFLHISGKTQESVNKAEQMVRSIMSGSSSSSSSGSGGSNNPLSAQVMVDLGPGVDVEFNLIGKLIGPQGRYVKHISSEAGGNTRVQLRGRESLTNPAHPEPLHLYITSNSTEHLEKAKKLASDLLGTIKQQYDEFKKFKASAPYGHRQHYQAQHGYGGYPPAPNYNYHMHQQYYANPQHHMAPPGAPQGGYYPPGPPGPPGQEPTDENYASSQHYYSQQYAGYGAYPYAQTADASAYAYQYPPGPPGAYDGYTYTEQGNQDTSHGQPQTGERQEQSEAQLSPTGKKKRKFEEGAAAEGSHHTGDGSSNHNESTSNGNVDGSQTTTTSTGQESDHKAKKQKIASNTAPTTIVQTAGHKLVDDYGRVDESEHNTSTTGL